MRRVTTKWGGDRHGAASRSGRSPGATGGGGGGVGCGGGSSAGASPSCWSGGGGGRAALVHHPAGKRVDAADVAVDVLRDDGRPYGGDAGHVDDDPAGRRWDAAAACAPWVVVEGLRLVYPSRGGAGGAAAAGGAAHGRGGGGGGGGGGDSGSHKDSSKAGGGDAKADWTTLGHLDAPIVIAEEERWLYGDKDLPAHKLQALEDWLSVHMPFATLQRVSAFLLTSSTAPSAAVEQRIRVLAEATAARAAIEADVDSSAPAAGGEEKKKKKGFKGFSLPGKKSKSSSVATAKGGAAAAAAAASPRRSRMNWEQASSEGAAFRRRAAGAGGGGTAKMTTAELLAEKRSVEETLARFDAQLAALAAGGDDGGDMADMLLPARQELDERLRGINARLVAGGAVTNVKPGEYEAAVPPLSADIIDGSCSSATLGGCVEVVRTSPLVSSPVSAQVDSDGSDRGSFDTSVSADEADCAQALRSVITFEGGFGTDVRGSPTTTYTSDFESDDGSSSVHSGGSNSDDCAAGVLSVRRHQRRLGSNMPRSPSCLRGTGSDVEFVIDLGDRRRDSPDAGQSRRYATQAARQRAAAELCVDDGDPSSDLENEHALAYTHRRHLR